MKRSEQDKAEDLNFLKDSGNSLLEDGWRLD